MNGDAPQSIQARWSKVLSILEKAKQPKQLMHTLDLQGNQVTDSHN